MTHLHDGVIQAFLDDELDAPRRAEVAEHLLSCEACRASHDELLRNNAVFSRAVSLLDADDRAAPVRSGLRARARSGTSSLIKAAGLVLALAAAGSAAVPGSPVREWIVDTLAPEAEVPEPTPTATPAETSPATRPAPAPAPAGVFVPVSEPAVVSLVALEGTAIRLEAPAGDRLGVAAMGGERDPVFRTEPGRIEVRGGVGGEVVVRLPTVGDVRVEVDGRLYAECVDGALRVHVPADTVENAIIWR